MKVRRKSLWRSQNNKLAIKRRNQRAAKELKRMERAMREEPMPDTSHVTTPPKARPMFTVTIRCCDGESVMLPIYEAPWGLSISPTAVARRVAMVLREYRPVNRDVVTR